jgi:hypothetical protein
MRKALSAFVFFLLSGVTVLSQVNACTNAAGDLGIQINNQLSSSGNNAVVKCFVPGGVGTISTPISTIYSEQIILFGPGFYTIQDSALPMVISTEGIHFVGQGDGATVLYIKSSSKDVFEVSGQYFGLENIHISVDPNTTRTAGWVINATGQDGFVRNVRLVDVYGGFQLTDTSASQVANGWRFSQISIATGGKTWHSLFRIYGDSSVPTITSFNLDSIEGAVRALDAPLIDIDSRVDTVAMVNLDLLNTQPGINPILRLHDSDHVGGFPRWIKCTNCLFEAPGTTAIDDQSGRDFGFMNSYVASSNNCIDVGSAATNTKILGSEFTNIAQHCIVLSGPSMWTNIIGNTFDDIGTQANNNYDLIHASNSASNFSVVSNTYSKSQDNAARYGVGFDAPIGGFGSGGFAIVGNRLTNLGTSLDNAAGNATSGSYAIYGNPGWGDITTTSVTVVNASGQTVAHLP